MSGPGRLWAPWRREYIDGDRREGCVLCGIAGSPELDRPNYVLRREAGAFVVLNRYPYIDGHMMVVCTRHLPDMSSLTPEESRTVTELLCNCERALAEGLGCEGINGGWNIGSCAGAGIEGHLHLHVLPRWPGDVNFMTSVAQTRVLSRMLEESYETLVPFFGDAGGDR